MAAGPWTRWAGPSRRRRDLLLRGHRGDQHADRRRSYHGHQRICL